MLNNKKKQIIKSIISWENKIASSHRKRVESNSVIATFMPCAYHVIYQ